MPSDKGGAAGLRTIIREATSVDAEELSSLRLKFWRDQLSKGLLDERSLEPSEVLKDSTSMIGRGRSCLRLAQTGNDVTGYVYGQIRVVPGKVQTRVARVDEIFVDPERSSVNTAFALMREILDFFLQQGVDRIQANVLDANKQGQQITELAGFRPNLHIYEYDFSQTD